MTLNVDLNLRLSLQSPKKNPFILFENEKFIMDRKHYIPTGFFSTEELSYEYMSNNFKFLEWLGMWSIIVLHSGLYTANIYDRHDKSSYVYYPEYENRGYGITMREEPYVPDSKRKFCTKFFLPDYDGAPRYDDDIHGGMSDEEQDKVQTDLYHMVRDDEFKVRFALTILDYLPFP